MHTLPSHIWPLTTAVNVNGQLEIGGCNTLALAEAYGTPLYLLDETTFRANCRAYQAAMAQHYPAAASVHYASKALLNTGIVQLLAAETMALDVVSGGELWVALRAGFPAERIHLHGNAKPRAELAQALAARVGNIVVDTLDELALLAQMTAGHRVAQSILLRFAPGITADTHAHIQTGQADAKFGLPLTALDAAARLLHDAPGLQLRGLHCHLGSQLFDYAPYPHAVAVLLDAAARLRDAHGIHVDEISPGGGLGVPYTADQPLPDVDAFAETLSQALINGCAARNLPLPRLVIEPGRSIVARAGVALYAVVARKQFLAQHQGITANEQPTTDYIHIDGGMADNIRPALYGARYTALLANRVAAAHSGRYHIAGRYCESGDVLLRNISLPAPVPGDLLAVAAAGAYTLSMASNYNLVPRPALVLVGDGRARLMQRRETYEDLVQRDGDLEV